MKELLSRSILLKSEDPCCLHPPRIGMRDSSHNNACVKDYTMAPNPGVYFDCHKICHDTTIKFSKGHLKNFNETLFGVDKENVFNKETCLRGITKTVQITFAIIYDFIISFYNSIIYQEPTLVLLFESLYIIKCASILESIYDSIFEAIRPFINGLTCIYTLLFITIVFCIICKRENNTTANQGKEIGSSCKLKINILKKLNNSTEHSMRNSESRMNWKFLLIFLILLSMCSGFYSAIIPTGAQRINRVYYYISTNTVPRSGVSCASDFSFYKGDDIDVVRNFISSGSIWLPLTLVQPDRAQDPEAPLLYDDGTPVTNFRWAPNEPNNANNLMYPEENCVELMVASNRWNDIFCSHSKRFMCTFTPICLGEPSTSPTVCGGKGDCVNTEECVCQEGTYFDGTSGCIACPDGRWSDEGAQSNSDCYRCPTDSACKNTVKTTCTIPYYHLTNEGNADCLTCPSGYYIKELEPDFQTCLPCPLGHFCSGTTGEAEICPTGRYANEEGLEECIPCPADHFVTENHIFCIPCLGEEKCTENRELVLCPFGLFEDDICKSCPDNHVCENGIATPCLKGYFIDAFNNCLPCPYGMSCQDTEKLLPCTNEYYSDTTGATTCSVCNATFYTNNSHTHCFPCLESGICVTGIEMFICNNQYFENGTCYDCPLGHFCIDSKLFQCPPGYYNDVINSIECKACPSGTFLSSSESTKIEDCVECPAGTFSLGGAAKCKPCPAGQWSNTSESSCFPCPIGTYRQGVNLLGCLQCPPGEYSTQEGSITCDSCDAGTFSSEDGKSCITCQAGTFSYNHSSFCELCPPGTYNPDTGSKSIEACLPCPYGGSIEGSTSVDDCSSCPPGTFINGTGCTSCKPGTYSQDYHSEYCTKCPPGTYLPHHYAQSQEECLSCSPGSFSQFEGAAYCEVCSAGEYSSDITTPCAICPNGTYSLFQASECIVCPSGTYSKGNASECLICPPGTFSSENSSECALCPRGSYQDLEGMDSCILCPRGTYNPNIGSSSNTSCIPCPIGTYSSSYFASSSSHCIDCPLGSFCDEFSLTKPKACPKGTFSTIFKSTSINNCQKCPKGTYSEIEGLNTPLGCEYCLKGYYSSIDGSPSVELCTPCPSGTVTETFPATSVDDCLPCKPGTYSPSKSGLCINCPIGTYNENFGASSLNDCIRCDPPATTKNPGSTKKSDCFTCPEGYYLDISIGACEACPAGTYFNTSKLNSTEFPSKSDCISCGQGYYQPYIGKSHQSSCIPCSEGTYAPLEKNIECTPCGVGFYSSHIASPSMSFCQPCPPGSWSSAQIAISNSTCNKCVPGTYSNITGGDSPKVCQLCPIGEMAEVDGSANCSSCNSNSCIVQGSSYEFKERTLLSEFIRYKDPSATESLAMDNIQILKAAISIGVPTLFFILFSWIMCCPLIISRKLFSCILMKVDWSFALKHRLRVGMHSIKKPTPIGGFLSIVVATVFLALFLNLFMDFFGNNKILLESESLSRSNSIEGIFYFETILVGRHKTCNITLSVTSFHIYSKEWSCENGSHYFQDSYIEGCKCYFNCSHCLPYGNQPVVSFEFEDYIATPMILYTVAVPHYLESKLYYAYGSLVKPNSIFTGNRFSHIVSYSLNQVSYISIPTLNSIYEVVGYSPINEVKDGYMIQLTGIVQGSSASIHDFTLEKGLHFQFEFDPAQGAKIQTEVIRQNLFTLCAQSFTLISVSLAIGLCLFHTWYCTFETGRHCIRSKGCCSLYRLPILSLLEYFGIFDFRIQRKFKAKVSATVANNNIFEEHKV